MKVHKSSVFLKFIQLLKNGIQNNSKEHAILWKGKRYQTTLTKGVEKSSMLGNLERVTVSLKRSWERLKPHIWLVIMALCSLPKGKLWLCRIKSETKYFMKWLGQYTQKSTYTSVRYSCDCHHHIPCLPRPHWQITSTLRTPEAEFPMRFLGCHTLTAPICNSYLWNNSHFSKFPTTP